MRTHTHLLTTHLCIKNEFTTMDFLKENVCIIMIIRYDK